MAKLSNSGFKYITPSKPYTPPKMPQGKPMSAGNATRASASEYGKLAKVGPGKMTVPMIKGS